jgi:organic hydroperoxide reductase OsmC/OhrA
MSHPSHRFQARIERTAAGKSLVEAEGRPSLTGGAPPEFGGSPELWSPEHLLVASVALCFVSTLEWFARRKELPITSLICEGDGTVDKDPGGLAFSAIHLKVRLTVPAGHAAAAATLVDRAKQACLVSRSLRTPVDLELDVQEGAG